LFHGIGTMVETILPCLTRLPEKQC
jgi:hypothetical protein